MEIKAGNLGDRLREIREGLGLSATDVENLTSGEFKAVTILSWEREPRRLNVDNLINICSFYGANPADIINPNQEVVSIQGLDSEDRKLVRNTVTRLRRKSKSERTSRAS